MALKCTTWFSKITIKSPREVQFSSYFVSVQSIGCFKDTSRRAIPVLEGKSPLLRGNYKRRRFAIRKCALLAIRRGYPLIGVQDGGQCTSGVRALRTFAKYGRSNRCKNGKGGPWANNVYRVIGECKGSRDGDLC